MLWTIEGKAKYLARMVLEAQEEDRDLEKAILEALKFLENNEKDESSGWNGDY